MLNIINNKLYFDNCDVTALAIEYGTPLYIISETEILKRLGEFRKNFIDKYENARVAYAAKAFFTLAMAKIIAREGMCIDVVSGGELYTAIKANFPSERIEFNGNNKTEEELRMAIEYGVGRIIVDGFFELNLIEKICKELNTKVKILFRITPGVKSSTHDYIVTGKKDSKFGFPLETDILFPRLKQAINSPYIDFTGLHYHVGSQLFDNDSYLKALDEILKLVKKIKETFDCNIKEINFGGGFGVTYTDEERKPISYFVDPLMEKLTEFYKRESLPMPNVVIEPGRSVVAEAGMTLYTIGQIKHIPGIRKYVSVDGGMADNIRPALYGSIYTGWIANKAAMEKTETVTICGKCCESGDILIKELRVPIPERGDIFAVKSTGAYGYSMASNYNRIRVPAVVLLNNGKSNLIVKRQTYDDILRNDLLPQDL